MNHSELDTATRIERRHVLRRQPERMLARARLARFGDSGFVTHEVAGLDDVSNIATIQRTGIGNPEVDLIDAWQCRSRSRIFRCDLSPTQLNGHFVGSR